MKITNGELPESMIPYASKFIGEYSGDLDGRPMHLTLTIEGRKVLLSSDSDWIGNGCTSQVGELKEVYAKKKKDQSLVTKAIFYFDAGKCSSQVLGREIQVTLKDKKPLALKLSIYARTDSYYSCVGPRPYGEPANQDFDSSYYPGPGYPGPGYPGGFYPYPRPGYPYNQCSMYYETYFVDGKFTKVQ